jgi:hypothetical protein
MAQEVSIYLIRQVGDVVLEKVALLISQLSVLVRIGLRDGATTDWSKWLTFPAEGYGEVMRHGPFLLRDVTYLEIDSVELRKLGRLLPEKEIDHTNDLETALHGEGITFSKNGSIFRITN